jgi:glycerophosphoryl diester phosphodiesterase
VIAFDWDFLAQLETIDSTIITGALGSDALTSNTISTVHSLGIDFINWEHSTITADELNQVHAAGLELWVWTVNNSSRIRELLNLGIDGITTDNPVLARQLRDQ